MRGFCAIIWINVYLIVFIFEKLFYCGIFFLINFHREKLIRQNIKWPLAQSNKINIFAQPPQYGCQMKGLDKYSIKRFKFQMFLHKYKLTEKKPCNK